MPRALKSCPKCNKSPNLVTLQLCDRGLSVSDGWAKDDLIYQWKEKDPVQVVPGLHLPRFTLEQYKSAYCDVITNTGMSK